MVNWANGMAFDLVSQIRTWSAYIHIPGSPQAHPPFTKSTRKDPQFLEVSTSFCMRDVAISTATWVSHGCRQPGTGRLMRPDATALKDLSPQAWDESPGMIPKNFKAGSHVETCGFFLHVMSEEKGNMLSV